MNGTDRVELVTKAFDIFNLGIYQTISVYGMITNIINIIIFRDPKFEDPIYIYLIAHSFADLFYLFFVFFSIFSYVSNFFLSFVQSYTIMLCGLYLANYLTSCLAIFNILIELIVSFQRLLILINAKYHNYIRNISVRLVLLVLFIFSLLLYVHEIIFYQVYPIERNQTVGSNRYTISENKIGKEHLKIYKTIAICIQFFRGPVCLISMVIINSLTWFHFRKYLDKKSQIKGGMIILIIFQL